MTVRVISRDNGVGLSRDLQLVAGVLRDAGSTVQTIGFGGDRLVNTLRQRWLRLSRRWTGPVDTQVFIERIYPDCLPLARRNVLIPNPEWTTPAQVPLLARFDTLLCKTRHAMDIYAALGCRTHYIGFTSQDRFDAEVPRERRFFHLAGRSSAKGTDTVLAAWRQHPEWPPLTVVQRSAQPATDAQNIEIVSGRVDEARLRLLQNQHAFHLCPSEAEGFGHYLMEALGVGAVVLTTDGAPMNELVKADRGLLIPPQRTGELNLAPRYFVDVAGIEAAVDAALRLDTEQRTAVSSAARQFFLDNDRAFRKRLVDFIQA